MQNHHDARFTAVVYTHPEEPDPYSFETDDFRQALIYVCKGDNLGVRYGVIIDNRLRKIVFRYHGYNSERYQDRAQEMELA